MTFQRRLVFGSPAAGMPSDVRPLVVPSVGASSLTHGHHFRRCLLYHAGRLSTYMLLALPAGILGRLLSLQGLGRAAAIAGAIVLLLMAFDVRRLPWLRRIEARSSSIAARACAAAAQWNLAHPIAGRFAAGAANGLLPCGMVYAAVAAALASGSLSGAWLMMAGFGLGTAPPLIVLSMSAASVPLIWRRRLQRATPAVLVLAAGLLLYRGVSVPASLANDGSLHQAHGSHHELRHADSAR